MLGEETKLGYGTAYLSGDAGTKLFVEAFDIGYRHIDTARLYGNEREVGDALTRTDVPREQLFVATKVAHHHELRPHHEGPAEIRQYVRSSIEESFERLDTDYIDLLYHHWPRSQEDIEAVLPIIDEYVASGRIKNLGVSNYTIDDVELARELISVPIAAIEVEMHPLLQQEQLREYLQSTETELVAYSPLAQGLVFSNDTISSIAEKHDVSEAVVSLAWLLSKDGVSAIPHSSSPANLLDNYRVLDIELETDDIERIDNIERVHRCEDPPWMTW